MWHEARKQEKKIRGMMVDYRKRAERRRDFYEKFKADPTQFLQLHGRPCKIHLDPAVAMAGDSASVMMPWQGQPDILIDRFDVRAHLDSLIEIPSAKNEEEELNYEERTMNYERYRILVQNEFLGVNEEKFLHQIYLEEQFGPIALKQSTEMMEKEKRKKGVAIGFVYEDSTIEPSVNTVPDKKLKDDLTVKDDSDSDSDLDFDLCLDLSQIDTPSAHEMNAVGQRFGLTGNDFFSFLTNDVEEQEAMKLARQQEEEKAMFSGRKARRERQAFREKKLIGRVMSPPSYAARKSPTYEKYSRSKSQSRSTSPENTGQITYITSFGGDDSNEENEPDDRGKLSKTNRKVRRKRSREKEMRSSTAYRSRRSKSKSRSKSPRRRRKHSRSRSMENRSLASNLKKLISKKNERRKSRSYSNDRFRNYSSKSRSRSRSRRTSWSSRSRSRSSRSRSRSRRGRSKSSRSASLKKRSRSRSNSSKSHSRSRSPSKDMAKAHDKSPTSKSSSSSRSASPKREETPKPMVPRYYGRNRKDSSSSLNLDSSDSDSKTNSEQPSSSNSNRNSYRRVGLDVSNSSIRSAGNARTTSKVTTTKGKTSGKTEKENAGVIKQAIFLDCSKRFANLEAAGIISVRADKKAEKERLEKAEQERQDREAELRDIAIKIRRRERFLRHMGEDEEADGEQQSMRRRERYLRRLGEEDIRRGERREGDCVSVSSGSVKSGESSPDFRQRKSRSPRRGSRRSRSPSPRGSRPGKRTLVDY